MTTRSAPPRTRRQHYVPACYLSQFASPQERYGRLTVFDRKTGRARPSTPDNEAHVRDFYAVGLEERADMNIAKDALAKLEGIFATGIARVNSTSGLPAQIQPLLAFIAMQSVRTPSARSCFIDGHNKVWMAMLETLAADKNAFLASAAKMIPDASDEEIEETHQAIREFLHMPRARVEMDQTTLIRDAFQHAPELEEALAERCWILGLAPEDTLAITSDDPVVLEWNGKGEPPASWHPGFGDPDTVVLLALGPRHLLAGVTEEVREKRRKQLTREQDFPVTGDEGKSRIDLSLSVRLRLMPAGTGSAPTACCHTAAAPHGITTNEEGGGRRPGPRISLVSLQDRESLMDFDLRA